MNVYGLYKIYVALGGPLRGVVQKRKGGERMGTCETIAVMLENLAYFIGRETGCALLWGEVEMPQCLCDELPDKM